MFELFGAAVPIKSYCQKRLVLLTLLLLIQAGTDWLGTDELGTDGLGTDGHDTDRLGTDLLGTEN